MLVHKSYEKGKRDKPKKLLNVKNIIGKDFEFSTGN